MNVRYAAISKTGRRSNNEDAFRVWYLQDKDRWMGIVCDGLGGHSMGEVASETVADAIVDNWELESVTGDTAEKVMDACLKASDALDSLSSRFHHREMGTTMVMVGVDDNMLTIAHIGDSRCYLVRPTCVSDDSHNSPKDHIVYQTKDHIRLDFGWEVLDKCFFSYQKEKAIPDIAQFEIQTDDRILLCSDGVYKYIAPDVLTGILMENRSPEEIIDVIDSLCEKNGHDNYTAIVAIIGE